jgi:hypothetical protein
VKHKDAEEVISEALQKTAPEEALLIDWVVMAEWFIPGDEFPAMSTFRSKSMSPWKAEGMAWSFMNHFDGDR